MPQSIAQMMQNAKFLSSAPKFSSLPVSGGREAAFAGRSNAGKSSVLNTIANRKALAKISSSPGKTRHINLFALDKESRCRLADLPGYGYAKVSVQEQKRWGEELTRYILERESLCGVVIVIDIRRTLNEQDKSMLTLCRTAGKPVHVLLNKSDKLNRSGLVKAVSAMEKELSFFAPGASMSTFSALKKDGIPGLHGVLGEWLQIN